jgi:hypothetical protein
MACLESRKVSAKGATYKSQGKCEAKQSASPLVFGALAVQGLKGRNTGIAPSQVGEKICKYINTAFWPIIPGNEATAYAALCTLTA